MRIESLRVQNFIGVRNLERAFHHPVVLFAGRNGAGKSSLQTAVRMALLGEPERVVLKKDYDKLVTEGAAGAECAIKVRVGQGLDEESTVVHLAIPDGKPTPFTKRPPFLEYCLEPTRFARLTDDERRSFLFGLTGLKADDGTVRKRLLEKGCDEALVDQLWRLKSAVAGPGFPALHNEAADRAREAKGAWRGVTGETWGKDKAADWKPKEVAFGTLEAEILQRVQADLAVSLEAERTAGNHLANLEGRVDAANPDLGFDPKLAAKVGSIQEDIERSEAERSKWETEAARLASLLEAPQGLACPHCGGMCVQGGFELKKYEGVDSAARDEARTKLKTAEESRDLMRRKVMNLKRDLAIAQEHAAKQTAAKAVKEKAPTPHELADAKEKHDLAKDKSRSLREEEARLAELQRAASAAAAAGEKAATHHRDVLGWLAIADAVSPSGIPAEMLSSALTPFNQKLREAAVMTGWRQVAIGADMGITSEGRLYALLSESERWRTDAMIAYAIAAHGPRFLMLDRLDVLDVPGRGEALAWVDALVDQKRLDGAFVCGTLKSAPAADVLPSHVEAYWLESGQVLEFAEAA